jgi:hypothetical protein
MNDATSVVVFVVLRVASPGLPAFQLRKGEEGISVFVPNAVEPPLTHDEVLDAFRPGSYILERTSEEIEKLGLLLIEMLGHESLPDRLRTAHHEIMPSSDMDRRTFKAALSNLE